MNTTMKNKYILSVVALAAITLSACSDMDDMLPQKGTQTEDQIKQTNDADPNRVSADLAGMYACMTKIHAGLPTNTNRHDDFGYPTEAISNDLNGADMVCENSGYNWFSVASEYSDRFANYANPYIRYAIFYNQIKAANDIIKSAGPEPSDAIKYFVGQAYAVRAFDYLCLASHFQFNYQIAADKPCVPLVTEKEIDFTKNPRASVSVIYDQVISDLTRAIEILDGFERPNKTQVDKKVALGLRARAYLAMGKWAEAAADANDAMDGYDPYTRAEVSVPAFCSLKDHNWMWGSFLEADTWNSVLASTAGQLASFSSNAYTCATGVYKCINKALYDKIPATDIRKQWWVDEKLHSDLLSTLSWEYEKDGKTLVAKGDDISTLEFEDKVAYLPYTNVKFGMKDGPGSLNNDNDWCYMRAEEMILIKAEGLYMSGKTTEGLNTLVNFVKNYRDPSYSLNVASADAFQTEIWKQRRIELWGEGFWVYDQMRLNKPVVRIHGTDIHNVPDAFAFNVKADDGYLLMRFCDSEMNTNTSIIDNTDGSQPTPGSNADLLDGVTD